MFFHYCYLPWEVVALICGVALLLSINRRLDCLRNFIFSGFDAVSYSPLSQNSENSFVTQSSLVIQFFVFGNQLTSWVKLIGKCEIMKFQILIEILVSMAKLVSQESGGRSQKEKALRRALREQRDLLNLCGLPLPLDPTVRVYSLVPDTATLFNSNLMPMKLSFKTERNDNFVAIFKRGDDLRYF